MLQLLVVLLAVLAGNGDAIKITISEWRPEDNHKQAAVMPGSHSHSGSLASALCPVTTLANVQVC